MDCVILSFGVNVGQLTMGFVSVGWLHTIADLYWNWPMLDVFTIGAGLCWMCSRLELVYVGCAPY